MLRRFGLTHPNLSNPPLDSLKHTPIPDLIHNQLFTFEDSIIQRLVSHLRQGHGTEITAIIFYGSCLSQETRSPTSLYDFYLLTDDLRSYHRSIKHTALNLVLPPNVYYRVFKDEITNGNAEILRCKCCVLTLKQFVAETSSSAQDIHHLGRFSKQFAVVYARDDQVAQTIVDAALSAMLTLLPLSLALLPAQFTLDEFIIQQLSLSYLGERRVAEPQKVLKIFKASETYYREIYRLLLVSYAKNHSFLRYQEDSNNYYQVPANPREIEKTQNFLKRSQSRGILRWPKYMLTVDNWLEYVLDKLERHQGIRLELTEREKRFPLIFGWPKYFALKRKGIVK